ncbi:MAG: hypothetical protein ACI9C1_000631 [Candidatus Aldehydirespiratoraceae bacterium]|jgi:hypothetical protein
MTNDDELRSRLGRLADTHDLGNLTVDAVQDRHTRGIRRQRFATMGVILVAVLAAAGVVRLANQGDDIPDVASADTDDATDDQPVDAGTTTTTTIAPNENSTTTAPGPYGASESDPAYSGAHVVAWRDGFLRFGQIYVESESTFTELLPDIADFFPPELIEAMQDAGIEDANGASLQETTDALEAAGLLDEVTEIFQENPDLISAFNEVQGGGTFKFEASTSPDGQTWTVLDEFAPPGTTNYFDRVESTGDALLLVSSEWPEGRSNPVVSVSTTTDLVNWHTAVVPTSAPDVPDWVEAHVRLDNIALGANGWYGITSISTSIDLWNKVPAAIRDEFEGSGGYGYSVGSEGLTINGSGDDSFAEYGVDVAQSAGDDTPADDPAESTSPSTTITAPATTVVFSDAEAEAESRLVTWDELGISLEDYRRYQESGELAGGAFVGGFDGSVSPATSPTDSACCLLVATDAGFIAQMHAWSPTSNVPDAPAQFFSADGQVWTELSFPNDERPLSLAAVAGGVVATTLGETGNNVWRGDTTGENWQQVMVDGLDQARASFHSGGPSGLAALLDLQVFEYNEPIFDLTFEYEGFELFSSGVLGGGMTFRLTDLSTGDVVLDESVTFAGSSADDFFREDLDNVVFLDGDGNDIVAIPENLLNQEFEAAREQAIIDTGWVEPDYVYNPDFSLVASVDGLDWHVIDLPGDGSRLDQPVISNGVVIVANYETGEYLTFTLD